ncbi:hypothetical protein GQ600_14011 [Phytophthora cactorum]|nr:hypothetical protein GQ600_14011 [Phytophthora cactorum]
MLEDAETLDAVFSFLSQIDLPSGFDEETHDGVVEMPSGTPAQDAMTPVTTPLKENVEVSGDDASPASSEDSVQPTKTDKPKQIRISRKQQIDTLRGEVQELNDQLQSLLPQWQPEVNNGQLVSRRAAMWEEIAARQLERQSKSEEENAKLREMLQIQIHEARNLRRVLKRRIKIEMMEDMLGMKRQKMLDYDVPDDNPQVFEDMLQDTENSTSRNITNGLFLELLQRHLVPFDLATTEKAVWKAMRQIIFQGLAKVQDYSSRAQFHAHHVEETANTLKTLLCGDCQSRRPESAQFRKVVRKYVENDRVVFICKNLMEPILHEKGKPSGFFTRTTLRIVTVLRIRWLLD